MFGKNMHIYNFVFNFFLDIRIFLSLIKKIKLTFYKKK